MIVLLECADFLQLKPSSKKQYSLVDSWTVQWLSQHDRKQSSENTTGGQAKKHRKSSWAQQTLHQWEGLQSASPFKKLALSSSSSQWSSSTFTSMSSSYHHHHPHHHHHHHHHHHPHHPHHHHHPRSWSNQICFQFFLGWSSIWTGYFLFDMLTLVGPHIPKHRRSLISALRVTKLQAFVRIWGHHASKASWETACPKKLCSSNSVCCKKWCHCLPFMNVDVLWCSTSYMHHRMTLVASPWQHWGGHRPWRLAITESLKRVVVGEMPGAVVCPSTGFLFLTWGKEDMTHANVILAKR